MKWSEHGVLSGGWYMDWEAVFLYFERDSNLVTTCPSPEHWVATASYWSPFGTSWQCTAHSLVWRWTRGQDFRLPRLFWKERFGQDPWNLNSCSFSYIFLKSRAKAVDTAIKTSASFVPSSTLVQWADRTRVAVIHLPLSHVALTSIGWMASLGLSLSLRWLHESRK